MKRLSKKQRNKQQVTMTVKELEKVKKKRNGHGGTNNAFISTMV